MTAVQAGPISAARRRHPARGGIAEAIFSRGEWDVSGRFPLPAPAGVGPHRPLWNSWTVVHVSRASRRCPISRHGTEYRLLPTLTWMSGPTLPVDHVANTNGLAGNGVSVSASAAANTAAGAAPSSGRHARVPA